MIKVCLIEDVTNQMHAVVTTSSAHLLETGMEVKIIVPPMYKMALACTTIVKVLDGRRFSTNIDTSEMPPFILPEYFNLEKTVPAQCFRIS